MRRGKRQAEKSGWISAALVTVVNVVALQDSWAEAWDDAREEIDSGLAALMWLLIFGVFGWLVGAVAALMSFLGIDPPNIILWVVVVSGLLGLGGLVAHGFGYLFGAPASWVGDFTSVLLAGIGILVLQTF